MLLKEKIYAYYLQSLKGKVVSLQLILADLKESGTNETKSTAGDKHETALVMLQIEQANTRAQLQTALDELKILQNINPLIVLKKISIGSVVKTNKGYFFMTIALGKSILDSVTVFALSPQSPLGAKLMGLIVGDNIIVNANEYLIEEVF